jgi:hypothetical protein
LQYKILVVLLVTLATLILVVEVVPIIQHPGWHEVESNIVRVYVGSNPRLELQVSPPGYPQAGRSWMINVYIVNETSAGPIYQPAVNSSVVVTVSVNGWPEKHELQTDMDGVASFQFLSGYTDVTFEAFDAGLEPSATLVVSTYYVSPEVVDTFLTFNAFSVLSAVGSGFLVSDADRKRPWAWTKVRKLLLVTACLFVCLFALVTLISVYSKLYQGTPWGYPENILDGFVTFSLMKTVFYLELALFIGFCICSLVIKEWLDHEMSR